MPPRKSVPPPLSVDTLGRKVSMRMQSLLFRKDGSTFIRAHDKNKTEASRLAGPPNDAGRNWGSFWEPEWHWMTVFCRDSREARMMLFAFMLLPERFDCLLSSTHERPKPNHRHFNVKNTVMDFGNPAGWWHELLRLYRTPSLDIPIGPQLETIKPKADEPVSHDDAPDGSWDDSIEGL